jgi:hypothetical protein
MPALLLLPLIGCGGSSSAPSGTGRAFIKITWPDRNRLIPLASNSIQVTFSRGAQTVATQLIPRPASGNQTTTTFQNLKTGGLALTATAFPNADGTGTAQATGTTDLMPRHCARPPRFRLLKQQQQWQADREDDADY